MRLDEEALGQQIEALSGEQKRRLASAAETYEARIEQLIRWLTGAHAGATIGALSLIGTTIAAGKFTDWLLIPVFLFMCGLLSIGLHVFLQVAQAQHSMIHAWPGYANLIDEAAREISPVFKNIDSDKHLDRASEESPKFLLISIFLFPTGVLTGLATLFFAI